MSLLTRLRQRFKPQSQPASSASEGDQDPDEDLDPATRQLVTRLLRRRKVQGLVVASTPYLRSAHPSVHRQRPSSPSTLSFQPRARHRRLPRRARLAYGSAVAGDLYL